MEATLGVSVKRCKGRGERWGLILAGGDGTRLRPLTRFICGDDRPKQFCALFDGATLLTHTRRRAERRIATQRLLYSLSLIHEEFYSRDLSDCLSRRLVQPSNKGTAPGIISGLLCIHQADEDAVVTILPADHHFSNPELFGRELESAFDVAAQEPRFIVVLGAQPDSPETEYGWIEPGSALCAQRNDLHRVTRFHEKPSLQLAETLLNGDCLWNTFVMVGSVRAFLAAVRATVPEILDALRGGMPPTHGCLSVEIPASLYEGITHTDFSRRVLSAAAERLLVLRLGPVGWSDLGSPNRALLALVHDGMEPSWSRAWREQNGPSFSVASSAVA